MEEVSLRMGPLRYLWSHDPLPGDCPECGGQCDGDECGLHAAGCVYGGPTSQLCYWLYAEDCPLYHGD